MTPAAFRNQQQNGFMKSGGGDASAEMEALAKRSFLRIDDNLMNHYRTYGKTPKAQNEIRLKGELTPELVKVGAGATSPMSQRASENGAMLGAMGTITAVSSGLVFVL